MLEYYVTKTKVANREFLGHKQLPNSHHNYEASEISLASIF